MFSKVSLSNVSFTCTRETILFSFVPTLLTRAFRNLILNAFLHGEAETEAALHICQEGTVIQITVSDNGKGIPEKDQENLFRRYYRGTGTDEKTEGTGLGLAIVKNIVSMHKGTISVSSIPGTGTAFHIRFPLS
ncbi:sensor histidine kinase [Eisenbergiella tayi]|uniref:sensor histidine kinase n=1 Tax=Eisenbergiella tayi TaxID=1432052 RepID=UPI001FA6C3F1|nr:ATP-binding protein [Eisenbergiella tayi]